MQETHIASSHTGSMDSEIEAAWLKLENNISEAALRRDSDWFRLYKEIITAAKQHLYFQNYFPLTSHYCLRFSVDKHLHESWPFFYSIEPADNGAKENYRVHTSMDEVNTRYFADVHSALDFLADLMRNNDPVKWR
jgi:hypothetical protein